MKRTLALLSALILLFCSCSQGEYPIKTKVPKRPAGQESVLGLKVAPIDTVKVGIIGQGMRGRETLRNFMHLPQARIVALCDIEQARVERGIKQVEGFGFPAPQAYYGSEQVWKEMCERDDIDLVYICTDWKNHAMMALYAMECGKHVAIEVPAAMNLEEIWALVDMAEKKRLHCIMMENCVYDFYEMTTLTMAQAGLFGEVIHVEGAYHHWLERFWHRYWNGWRMEYNKNHRGDSYPTHGIGPICQVLNIHRGDRMKTLVSMDTKAVNGPKAYERLTGQQCEDFKAGDQTSTLIRTEKGKTMLIQHNVMTPRPYDRLYQVVGTDGYAGKYPQRLYCFRQEADPSEGDDAIGREKIITGEEMKALQEQYRNPVMTPELEALAKKVGGHGGMDFTMIYRLIYCLNNGLPLDMDVYDLAEWCCLTELTAISLENGSAPVEIPDFTRGEWDRIDGFSYAFK